MKSWVSSQSAIFAVEELSQPNVSVTKIEEVIKCAEALQESFRLPSIGGHWNKSLDRGWRGMNDVLYLFDLISVTFERGNTYLKQQPTTDSLTSDQRGRRQHGTGVGVERENSTQCQTENVVDRCSMSAPTRLRMATTYNANETVVVSGLNFSLLTPYGRR
ncbi:hypothetical protein PIB30_070736 [Stylosanthes scabra]|uniref:Uncharacterized protein n=1 Tax=Stylosanthes scabra TaxID=79078 RepID=A0ABU6XPA6_9FABA|nr:hypothetical protein [Stylosanthes scabra]